MFNRQPAEGGKKAANVEQAQQPAISLPKGGGSIRGIGEKFAANPVTGTASVTVPIAVSPGRSGFGPQLSLSYDSGSGNGPFGFGWSLSIPSITRKTDRGLPQYHDGEESDVFILSGAEDLVPVLRADGGKFEDSGTASGYIIHRYRPRIEGLFARIERWTNRETGEIHWRSITQDNITSIYGKDKKSRIFDPVCETRVFSWLISESYDDKGNAVVYEYVAENSEGVDLSQLNEKNRSDLGRSANRYLKSVKYGNLISRLVQPDLTQTGCMFEVVFDYGEGHCEELPLDPVRPEGEQHRYIRASAAPEHAWAARPDPFFTCRAGFEVRAYRRCRRVLMFHHFAELGGEPCLVRSTEFEYADLDYSQPVAVEDELAHQGSTRFASFILAVTQAGFIRDDSRPVIEKNGVKYFTYLKKSLPPVEFAYSKAAIQEEIREMDAESLENLPVGLGGTAYRWVDLDGEGVCGILTEQPGAWFYKPNLGEARFGPLEKVAAIPSPGVLTGGRQQLLDLAGDGQLDLVEFAGPAPGFFERTHDRNWERFTPFASLPNIPWDEPNLRFVDLNGDGHADVLISEHEVFTWHPSLAEEGFGPAQYARQATDEEQGPRLVFADGTQSVYLADMCGDGLADLLRIRNGAVCYWPNLGYGRFGPRVSMDNAPWFDSPDQFDQRRVCLADIDGSGTNDIIYLGRAGVRLYFNQSGNRWSEPRRLSQLPGMDNLGSVMTADLLGNGTACLVWSSPLPGDTRRQMRYIDLMGGQKPHLLVSIANNLGAETHVRYAPSTRFYLADKAAGRPWITRLPFPVHVVERVETYDRVSRNRFVVRYAYHHGYFDGIEREFRGFGMVEQWDTEEFAALSAGDDFPAGDNVDASTHVPPVLTKTWFHTGAFLQGQWLSRQFEQEYYREPGLSDAQFLAQLLPDTVLPPDLSAGEAREACRALKGSVLRQEVYALDGTEKGIHPYSVSERGFALKLLQPRGGNRHAVFLAYPQETIEYHYERHPADPRVSHTLTLEVDDFGNVLKSAAIGYGRRRPDPGLPAQDQARQTRTLITYTENSFTKPVDVADAYRTPLPWETRNYELTGYSPSGGGRFLSADFVHNAASGLAHSFDNEISYEETPAGGRQRRLIGHARTLYRADNLAGPLPPGEMQAMALPFESYELAFTPGLVDEVYEGRVTGSILEEEGRYVHSEGDANWWIPSGWVFYSPGAADDSAAELAHARRHFFLPHRYRDPFGETMTATYDNYDLLMQETRDALDNRVTVGERDQAGILTKQGNDYRVLQPGLLMDPNRNRAAVAFDALGMVVGTAVMGKPEENLGDSLDGFKPVLTKAAMNDHLQSPFTDPHEILRRATTRLVYDLFAYRRTRTDPQPQPPVVYSMAREIHDADLQPGQQTRIQHSFSYADGFGREIQRKIQAEAGPVQDGGPVVSPRWLGSGWTIFNNKGKPVKNYEPFFSASHEFEFARQQGVSSTLFYDPLERVVAALHPDHTYEKVVFSPWRQEDWDVNDTVLIEDPKADPDVGGFFSRLSESEYLPGWYTSRISGADKEKDAAEKTAKHASTPAIAHLDTLGRTFLTIADNGKEKYETRAELDIEGNRRSVTDPRGNVVIENSYNLPGNTIYLKSMDAGERRMLADVAGKPLRSWDSRGHEFSFKYDALRRPLETRVKGGDGPVPLDNVYEKIIYGEGKLLDSKTDQELNLRGKPFVHYDTGGKVQFEEYDYKGNAAGGYRQLARDYKQVPQWNTEDIDSILEDEKFVTEMAYDALNRVIRSITPDGSITKPIYNEANLLEKLQVEQGETETEFIRDMNYDASGRRTEIRYGNGARTICEYDPETFRLIHLRTTKEANGTLLQDLYYVYDPVGNITQIEDRARPTVFFNNFETGPVNQFTYDALYRLVEARGREHIAQVDFGGEDNWNDLPFLKKYSAQNPMEWRNYTQQYLYDSAGNIGQIKHIANGGSWTRNYAYETVNNRLKSTTAGTDTYHYPYHPQHGFMEAMPHLPVMQWNFRDELRAVARQRRTDGGVPETTYYVYDSSGRRIRKITENAADAGAAPAKKDERIYVGGIEIYREHTGIHSGLERKTLYVMDGKNRIAMVETRNDVDDGSPERLVRYQFSNHLGTACLEMDDCARMISYEEYHPYGATSYQAVDKEVKASAKRYRYTGKERDEETGLYYHGARYYAPWLGRWTAADPAGLAGGFNYYRYTENNPIRFIDTEGMSPKSPDVLIHEIEMKQARKEQLARDLEAIQPRIERTADTVGYMESVIRNKKASGVTREEMAALRSAEGYLKKLVKEQTQWTNELNAADKAIRDRLSELSKHSVKGYIKGLEAAGEKEVADSVRREMADLLKELHNPEEHWDERFRKSSGTQMSTLPPQLQGPETEVFPATPPMTCPPAVPTSIQPEQPQVTEQLIPPVVPGNQQTLVFPSQPERPPVTEQLIPQGIPQGPVYIFPTPTPGVGVPSSPGIMAPEFAPALLVPLLLRDLIYIFQGKEPPGSSYDSRNEA